MIQIVTEDSKCVDRRDYKSFCLELGLIQLVNGFEPTQVHGMVAPNIIHLFSVLAGRNRDVFQIHIS